MPYGKVFSIPVTNEQNQLVSATDVVLVEQASTTTVTITYKFGKVTTITHATAGSGDETERDAIQDAIVAALHDGSACFPWYPFDGLSSMASGTYTIIKQTD